MMVQGCIWRIFHVNFFHQRKRNYALWEYINQSYWIRITHKFIWVLTFFYANISTQRQHAGVIIFNGFLWLLKGDNDDLQIWPFQKKITMMLLDQGDEDHVVDTFHADPQSSSFQRPKCDMNIASGYPLFMPIDCLNHHQYIKDDVMIIKIIVE